MRVFIGKCLVLAILINGMAVGARADQRGLDYPHNSAEVITCNSCHYLLGVTTFPWLEDYGNDIDDTMYNNMCWSCHNGIQRPRLETHSSLATSTNHGSWSVECRVCHWPHHQKQLRTHGAAGYLVNGQSAEVTTYTLRSADVTFDTNELAGNILIPDTNPVGNKFSYQYRIDGNTGDTITVEQPIDSVVRAAGRTFAVIYGRLVNSTINLGRIATIEPKADKSGTKTVRLFRPTGANSFADGDAVYDGVCEVCHTETDHYMNNGQATDQDHANLDGKNGTDCFDCHSHAGGFKHGGIHGCAECHGHDLGAPYDDDMAYPNDGSGDGEGGTCKGAGTLPTQSHSTHTETTNDDLRGPGIYCDTCHDLAQMPKFKNLDGSGGHSFVETDICNNCHSSGGTYDGVDDPVIGAKANWAAGIYDGNNLKAGREKWCVTCHDKEPADSKYNDTGVNAPNIAGDEDEAYTYGTGWGYYKTGHGLPAGEAYPSKGGLMPPPLVNGATRAVECNGCHNLAAAHIDHNARTFDDGGSTTLDSSFYRIGYRLKQVSSGTGAGESTKEPIQAPRLVNSGNTVGQARLCYNCHDSSPFIEDNNPNTNLKTDSDPNIHEYHMVMNSIKASTDWSGGDNSRMTCLTCHDVHGSTRLAMVRDGRLINRTPGLEIWYHNDDIVSYNPNNDDPPVPASLPLSASTGTLWVGNSSGNLCSHCHGDITMNAEYRVPFQTLTQPPTLAWTGETNYASDGANPDSGVNGASFIFRVKYTDTNNDPPTSIQVWIDDNNNGYEPGEKYTLSQVDAGDTTYFDGKLYTLSRVLTNTAGNVKPYRFYAVSNGVEASGPPAASGSVYVLASGSGSGSAPTLAWTGEPNFTAEGVDPDSAVSGSTFIFRVEYTDTENNPPVQIELWIDEDRNGAFSQAEKYAMTEDGGGADYTAGRFFTKGLVLTGADAMSYRFHATDGNSLATGTPTAVKTVTVFNNVPNLDWTGEANYTADGIHPNTGAGGTNFTFRVKYTDADNTAPSAIQVWVDTDNSGVYDAHEKFSMTQDDDDGDALLTNGEKYSKTVTIPFIGDGVITYRFYASDGADAATGDAVSNEDLIITAPVGNTAPILAWTGANCLSAGVRPGTGADGTDFEFKVVYSDTDPGQCAAEILLYLDADDDGSYGSTEKYVLTGDAGDVDCTDGRLYETSIALANAGDGALNYRFHATDGYQAATGTPVADSQVYVLNALKVRPAGGDGWYSGIGDAVDNSGTGSTILVYPNSDYSSATYNENISLISADSDDLTFKSACGADFTTIASVGGGTTFSVQDASNFVMDGFTITGATSSYGIIINRTDGTTATIKNSKIHGNSHGIYINDSDDAPVRIENTEIYNNSTRGITLVSADDDAEIINSTIHSHNSVSGGAIAMNNSNTVAITNSIIRDNIVSGEGGAIYINLGSLTITNSIFTGNRAGTNGGVFRTNSGPTIAITNSTFADNQGTNGGVFYICSTGSTTIRNSIFWNNTSTSGNGANIYKGCGAGNIGTISDSDITTSSPSIYNASFTDEGGIVNPAADPFFQGLGNYHLQSGSPVKNLANAAYAPADDIDGDARPLDGGDDLGADEYKSADLAPVLAWTGETNYTTDGVNPNTGASGDNFVFRVKYTDTEDVAPSKIQVWVDMDDDGSYEANEKYDMTGADITDVTYANGKIYTKTLNLTHAGDANLNYRFFATDQQKNATGAPNADNTVTVNNGLPVGGYTADNVIPAAQVVQSTSGNGIITISWKGRDNDSDNVTLNNFQYSVNGGSNWSAPTNGDNSLALSTNWRNDGGGGYSTATTFGAAAVHGFTFDTDHADVSGMAGIDQSDVRIRFTLNDGDDSALPATSENFRVDNVAPADTIISANYDQSGNTMLVTGTNFTSVAAVSTDIKGLVDWSKLVWDINGDNTTTPDISFVLGDIDSLIVANDTTLTLVLTPAKAMAVEATVGYGPAGGADTLDIVAGFSRDAAGNAASTDGVADAPLALSQIIAGTVYIDEGLTPISDGATVRLLVNGASSGTGTTTGGSYSINTVVNGGDAILVYLDGAATDGTTVSVSNGSTLTGLDIYADRLITRHDNSGSLTIVNLGTAKGAYGDAEILYSVAGSDLAVSGSNTELFVPTGHAFAPAGVVNAINVDINGALNAAANALNVSGNWDATGGVFTSNGTVTFNATSGTVTITPGGIDASHDFQNIVFNDGAGTATYLLAGALDVDGNLTVTDGIFDTSVSNYAVTVGGNFSQNGGRVNGHASAFTVAGNFLADGTEDSTGFNSATLTLSGIGGIINYNNLASWWVNGFNNLTVGQGGVTDTLNNWLAVKNDLTIGAGGLTGPVTVALTGTDDVLAFNAASSLSIDTLMFLKWEGGQNIPPLANGYGCDISLAGDGVVVTQTGDVTLNSGKSLYITGDSQTGRAATYNVNSHTLTVGGNLVVGAGNDTKLKTVNATGSAINLKGDFIVTAVGGGSTPATFIATGSTVTLNGTGDQTITSSGSAFNNLTLNNTGAAGSDDIVIADSLDINGVFTVTDGDLDLGTNNPALHTAGTVSIGAGGSIDVTGRTANWIFDGASTLSDSSSLGPQDLQDVVLNGTSLTLGSNAKVKTMTVTAGTLNLGGSGFVLEIDGTGTPLSNSGTFTAGTSTLKYSGTGSATNIATLAYKNLQLAPTGATTYSLTGHLTGGSALTGNLTIGANATLSTSGGNYNVALAGNWTNSGSFAAGTGTVTLTGTGQAVNGSTTFNNLTKSVTSGDTLTFQAGSTTAINGTVTLTGAAGQLLTLASSTGSSYWNFNVNAGATKAIDYVSVSWSNASGSDPSQKPIAPTNSVDGLNNLLWFASGANTEPTLSWATANCLTHGVRPTTGVTGADFEFRITYTDVDDDPPSTIQVMVDLNDDSDYDDVNEINTMTIDGGDGDYTNGEIYKYVVAIPYSGNGTLKYKFTASDGTDLAIGDPTSDGTTLTVVNTAYKVRPAGGGGWYGTIVDAIAASSDPSTILVYPNSDFTSATYGSFALSTKNNRTIQAVCGADLTTVSGGTNVTSFTNSNAAVVDGFSITGGSSRGVYLSCNANQSFTLKNSKVYSNTAEGLYEVGSCKPITIEDSKIYSNNNTGIYLASNSSQLILTGSEVYSNSTTSAGGGIYILGVATTTHTITDSVIRNNTASSQGGGIYCNTCTMTIENSMISDNTSSSTGGALYSQGTTNFTIDNSIFNGNKGTNGGAFYFQTNGTTVNITDSFIQGNEATTAGGAIYGNASGSLSLTNAMLTGNKSAGQGGAIYNNWATTTCLFCTISGNYAGTQGGGIYLLSNATVTVKNSIVYNNDAGSPTDTNYRQIESNYRWSYVDVYNTLINQSPGSGTGNPRLSYEDMGGNLTSHNPSFVDGGATPPTALTTPTAAGDFRIQSGSSAVNAASASWTVDHDIFDGTPGSRPKGGGYDMGAHEKE